MYNMVSFHYIKLHISFLYEKLIFDFLKLHFPSVGYHFSLTADS